VNSIEENDPLSISAAAESVVPWQLTVAAIRDAKSHWKRLPAPTIIGLDSPEDYIPSQATVDAVNVALALGQPLLVTGEPGCGKSALADWVAYRLGLGSALRFQTRSTAGARDLFYIFDAVGRFNAAQNLDEKGQRPSIDPRAYITYTGLGEAVMRALGRAALAPYVDGKRLDAYAEEPTRSVVLVDEIDKAPRDFPNDVLGELENFAFTIPELGGIQAAAPKALLPIVIVTSNIERTLPDAFLRRCVYHHMMFPEPAALERIIYARIKSMPEAAPLVGSAVRAVSKLRGAGLRKPPGTAELLAFVLALRARGLRPVDRLEAAGDGWIGDALITLVKTQTDQNLAPGTLLAMARSDGRQDPGPPR
jgi:MoxR-like ATPase